MVDRPVNRLDIPTPQECAIQCALGHQGALTARGHRQSDQLPPADRAGFALQSAVKRGNQAASHSGKIGAREYSSRAKVTRRFYKHGA